MVSAVPPPVGAPQGGAGTGGVRGWFLNVHRAVTSIFEGLSVTMSWMFRRPMTIQYPDKIDKPVQEMLPEGYRGILEVDLRLCTGCLLCEKTCPLQCIDVGVEKNAAGGRDLTRFDIDIARCMYCGLCTEACSFGALQHTTQFEGSASRIDDLTLHFLSSPVPVARHKAGEAPPRLPRGSILKGVIPAHGSRTGKAAGAATPLPPPFEKPAPKPVEAAPEPPKEETP